MDKKPKEGGGTTPEPRFKVKVKGSNKTITARVKGGRKKATKNTQGGSSGGGERPYISPWGDPGKK